MAAQNSSGNDEKGTDIMKGDEKSSLIKADLGSEPPPLTDRALSDESVVSEYEPEESDSQLDSHHPQGQKKCSGSSYSLPLRSDQRCSSFSSDVLSPSHQSETGEDCAAILLACLYCKFYDFLLLLPDTCERAMTRCCPSYRLFCANREQTQNNDCGCDLEFDCGLFDACHDSGECLELAMEISEVCYR